MKLTLTFTDPLALKVEHSGGKGSNLALLTQRGFAVPPGFIITARAYREFIADADELLSKVNRFAFDDPAQVETEAGRLRGALARFNLPSSLVAEVRLQLAQFPSSQCFSVRSSSPMQALAGAAFAVQHE